MKTVLLQMLAMFALAPMYVLDVLLQVILTGLLWLLNTNDRGIFKIANFVGLSKYL